jgi:hypothetical protein
MLLLLLLLSLHLIITSNVILGLVLLVGLWCQVLSMLLVGRYLTVNGIGARLGRRA